MEEQRLVSEFIDDHDLRTTPTYRVLDLTSEVGELAKDVNESSDYGHDPTSAEISRGELGDVVFCVLALADEAGIDAEDALEDALSKYEDRLETGGTPGSDSHDS